MRVTRKQMAPRAGIRSDLPQRLRRVLELVYGVEGVIAARVWQWPGRIAVGVRAGNSTEASCLLGLVATAVAGLREPGEVWDFGVLEDGAATQPDTRG